MNSYQKLKAKNKELSRVLNLFVFQPECAEVQQIKFNAVLAKKFEDAVMFGNSDLAKFTTTDGLINKISQ